MQNKRIVAVFILLVFSALLAIGGSAVFAVADVLANYTFLSDEQSAKTPDIQKALNELSGKNIAFIKKSQIENAVKQFSYIQVTSVQKDFPNVLTVTLTERLESFAYQSQNGYFMLDESGFCLSHRAVNMNNIDLLPNIILDLPLDAQVGSVAKSSNNQNFLLALESAKYFNSYYNNAARNYIEKISIDSFDLTINLKGGMTLVVLDYNDRAIEKLNLALDFYGDGQKLSQEQLAAPGGKIIAHKYYDGLRATFTTN